MRDSIWFQTISEDQHRLLDACDPLPNSAQVAIIGAGMIGLSTAYYLCETGVTDICVLDRGGVLGEASGANAGGLWFAQQSAELGPVASLAAASSRLYDELGDRFSFDFERSGMLELIDNEEQAARADEKLQATVQAGFRVEKVTGTSARSLEPGLGLTPHAALFYPEEGHLHPARLGAALVGHLKSKGVRFCVDGEVRKIRPAIETAGGAMDAETVVIASGAWTAQVTESLGWSPPIKPMRGTLLAVDPLPKTLHRTIVTPNYYYWQLAEGHVAGGGSVDDVGFGQGVDPDTTALIRREMNNLIPAVAELPTACSWSGFRPYSEDLKPVIGEVPGQERMLVAAGHFKKGIMLAPVTGKILADLITTRRTDLSISPLSPARFALAKKA